MSHLTFYCCSNSQALIWMHSYCFDEIVHTRSQVLIAAFHAALTVGGPGGTPRPIEMHAHDPLRYVGDMLAWLHQAIATEFELLNRVFGNEGWVDGCPSHECPLSLF